MFRSFGSFFIYIAMGFLIYVLFWDQHIDFQDGWFYVIVFGWPLVMIFYLLKWVLILGACAFVVIMGLTIFEQRKKRNKP